MAKMKRAAAPKSLGRKRLLKLADFLESPAVKPKRFNMEAWAQFKIPMNEAPKRLVKIIHEDKEWDTKRAVRSVPECGTAACALGWGTAMPSLKRLGLVIVDDESYIGEVGIADPTSEGGYALGASIVCLRLFGISPVWSDALFIIDDLYMEVEYAMPDADPEDWPIPKTPKQAAKHIRRVVAEMDLCGDCFAF